MKRDFSGIYTPLATPFTRGGDLDSVATWWQLPEVDRSGVRDGHHRDPVAKVPHVQLSGAS